MYKLSKYDCLSIYVNGLLDIYKLKSENQIVLFKGVLDFDLQSHQGGAVMV